MQKDLEKILQPTIDVIDEVRLEKKNVITFLY